MKRTTRSRSRPALFSLQFQSVFGGIFTVHLFLGKVPVSASYINDEMESCGGCRPDTTHLSSPHLHLGVCAISGRINGVNSGEGN